MDHIFHLISTKSLIIWTKIKGHSGIHGNEEADTIAKDIALRAKTDLSLIISPLTFNNHVFMLNFVPVWQGLSWNGNIRSNFSALSSLYYSADWTNNRKTSHLFDISRCNTVP